MKKDERDQESWRGNQALVQALTNAQNCHCRPLNLVVARAFGKGRCSNLVGNVGQVRSLNALVGDTHLRWKPLC